jgi:hypothetical protein
MGTFPLNCNCLNDVLWFNLCKKATYRILFTRTQNDSVIQRIQHTTVHEMRIINLLYPTLIYFIF